MALYKLNETGVVKIENGMHTDITKNGTAWQEYQDWVIAGNTPDPADPTILPTYAENRASEYPAIGELVDELLKVITIPAGSGLELLEAERQAIKTKYPKVAV